MLEPISDEQLILAYAQGDAKAFETLLRRYERPIYYFIYRMVANSATAEDLVQETFLRVVHHASEFERRSKFSTWLYTIARNLCHDHGRRQKFRRHVSLDEPLGHEKDSAARVDFVPSRDSSPHEDLEVKHTMERLEKILETLSEEQREVFWMRERAGLQFKEIAEIVGAPENTVKTRMRHALEKLQKALASQDEEVLRLLG